MKSCLIVDDSEVVRKVAAAIIGSMKFSTVEAATEDEVLAACKRDMPDVIFLDWHLPGSNSIELIKSIRAMGVFKRPYILYCMTEMDPDVLSRASNAGIDDHILKPFDRAGLGSKLNAFHLVAVA